VICPENKGDRFMIFIQEEVKVLLFFLCLSVAGLAAYLTFANLWIRYVFAHIGGLGVIGLLACWASFRPPAALWSSI
jgi:hypothetical protein